MNKKVLLIVAVAGIIAGFIGGVLFSGQSLQAQAAQRAPAAQATPATPKEPKATAEEFKSHVIRYTDLPPVELVKGANSRLIAGEESMISFLKMDKNSFFAPHRHKQEQIMIVLDGYCDEIIEGKLYRVQKGDVIVLPSNIEHGAYMYDQDVTVIDVFGEVRADYLLKMTQAMAAMNTKK
jgi:quercetin dioxygenase-like cupin family protein